jgi:Ca-activated chloride channel family protein
MEFRFADPLYLVLLCLLPGLWLLRRWYRPPTVRYAPADLLFRRRKSWASLAEWLPEFFLVTGFIAAICALARPQLGITNTEIRSSGIDIMIALDVSRSMLAEDYTMNGERISRIDVVKQVTQKFIEARPNDRIGALAFAGRPFLISPLTLDHRWLQANLERLRIGLTEDGTAIGSALISAGNHLRDPRAKSRVIVLLTDGDNNAGQVAPFTAAEAVAALGIRIYTIGAGTNGMVPFPETDRFGNKFYTEEYMPFQEDTCRTIAQIGHGKFFRAADTRSLQEIFESINNLERVDYQVHESRDYQDLFIWFVGSALALVAASIALSETVWRKLP